MGGSTALLLGIRDQTVDIDLTMEPEPPAVFEAIALSKKELSLNVELASPDQFLPPLPGWQDRSQFIDRHGVVDFYHYVFYSQCMAKVLRSQRTDLADAHAIVALGKVEPAQLMKYFMAIRDQMIRYPALNPVEVEARVLAFVGSFGGVIQP